MVADAVRRLLECESLLLLAFAGKEQELQDSLLERDFAATGMVVWELERLGAEIDGVERERHAAMARALEEAGLDGRTTFSDWVSRLDETERPDLSRLYRALQVAALRVRSLTGGIDAYVRSAMRTGSAVLGEVFPDQKGTIYCRRGRNSKPDGRAMVLDRHL